jgi:drug/metabolite transporter (DMT)-like permease
MKGSSHPLVGADHTGRLLILTLLTMILAGLLRGERFTPLQTAGLLLALGGLVALLLPGATAPHRAGATLMFIAGIAWGAYSLMGRASTHPIETTAGNFLRAAVFAALLSAVSLGLFPWDARGALRLVLCSVAILGGIALVLHARKLSQRQGS